ncbi:methyltransferase domain-containing protein [Streptomyces sp. MNP-20]|uniref:methyltransferase domain-containing protein n=1 Tax=Streptomyces sp. MNP-20 TaxID=2721165 RepID=UPI001556C31F|nr:methyltransferase domain-containing protein [Streptomyces sp. MNP-20]
MTAINAWLAEDYAQVNAPHIKTALAALERAGGALDKGGTFAEIGCGTGEVARAVAERGFDVWASDASPSMVAATRQRCAGLPVRAEVCPAEQLQLPEGQFDLIHSSWVLHWLAEAEEPLRRMARALRPGGHLVLQWSGAQPRSDGAGMFGVVREVSGSAKWKDLLASAPPAMRDYPAEDVARVLRDAGLELTDYDPAIVHALGGNGAMPSAAELAEMRRRYKLMGFATQADALGERVDEFVDEVLLAAFAAGKAGLHHARIVARRPE